MEQITAPAIGPHRTGGRLATCALAGLLLGAALTGPSVAASDPDGDRRLVAVAQEARQTIAVIDWFYAQHRACPQPSRPSELAELQSGLGDGFSVIPEGRFVAIRGISMSSVWYYYSSPRHPDKCTLWRKLGWDFALIWRRYGSGGKWAFNPGDGRGDRPVRPDL